MMSIYLDQLKGESSRPRKVAWIFAILAHFTLFIMVFPESGAQTMAQEQREPVVIKIYKPPEPPKQQPEKKVVKKKTARVPIPDPTPDDPEPIVEESIEYIEADTESADTEFLVAPPSSGPPVPVQEGPVRAGGSIQQPEKLVNVDPEYSELARRARLSGMVIIEALIDREGNVTEAKILRSLGLGLDEAALAAVQQWKYTPTLLNGRPVEVIITVTVLFKLQ